MCTSLLNYVLLEEMFYLVKSPKRPPDAKANNIFNIGCFSAVLSNGMKYRMKNGAALMSNVDRIECNQMSVISETKSFDFN